MDKDYYKLWIEKAEYDLHTAKAMLDTGRYNYVAIMMQQAIEKLLKGIFIKKFNKLPTRTHNLNYLVAKNKIEINEDTEMFFDDLVYYYIVLRYPDVGNLAITENKAYEIYQKGMTNFAWLKQLIE